MILSANPKAQNEAHRKEIKNAINRVIDSGWYVLGREVKSFEKEFAKYNNSKYAVGVANGTEALFLSLIALGIKPGDEIITSSHTAVATASAIDLAGAKPIFVDIDADHFTIRSELIESAITKKTKAIIPVHIYGQPCDMDNIKLISDKHGLKLIEDCAQAHGALYKGIRVGNFGHMGCFSFYPTKNLGAIGDGGAIVTNDKTLYEKLCYLREYGWEKRYISSYRGWNSRLDEIQAAILNVKLKHLDSDNKKRQEHAAFYTKYLSDLNVKLPVLDNNCSHVFHLYVIKTDLRDDLKDFLALNEIQTSIQYPIPIHQQDYYKHNRFNNQLKITENVSRLILSLPLYPEIQISDLKMVIEKIRIFFDM